MSYSSEKGEVQVTQLPKVTFWGLGDFFLPLGKLKWLVCFRTERKMQILQFERSLISGSHSSHMLCVFQTDLTLRGFYGTDSGNKPGFANKTNKNMFKITRFCCMFEQNGLRVPREMSALPDMSIVWWAKGGVKGAIFSIF